ncbi:MAG TPA: Smr/MutS family protein [Vicinamibacterales bacterium]|nr:Smr/MutS family protein [Vicinamibacterales bacterium]
MYELPIEESLDLHTFEPREIVDVVEEYVRAAHEAGFREVRLIHGRGKGVQRARVQQALDQHPLVAEFWDDTQAHLGATVARLVQSHPAPSA